MAHTLMPMSTSSRYRFAFVMSRNKPNLITSTHVWDKWLLGCSVVVTPYIIAEEPRDTNRHAACFARETIKKQGIRLPYFAKRFTHDESEKEDEGRRRRSGQGEGGCVR